MEVDKDVEMRVAGGIYANYNNIKRLDAGDLATNN